MDLYSCWSTPTTRITINGLRTRKNRERPRKEQRAALMHLFRERAWKQMKASLHHLGVKKILLGGMYLGSHTWKGRPYLNLFSCVGDTNNALKNEFEVEMSSLTYPLTRKDYLRTLREESARPKPAGSGQQK